MESEEVLEVKRPRISESGVDARDSPRELTNTLTYYALLKLFTWLSREDLVSVQRVCHSWRMAAHDQSLWKDFILTLDKDYHYKDLKNINTMKAVRNINGKAGNAIINVIIKNIKDLKQLNCKFTPPITSSQVERLLQTFPELESISLDFSASDIVQSIQKLKTSEYLKDICFYFYDSGKNWVKDASESDFQALLQNILMVFEILNDIDNFKGLQGLHIEECLDDIVFKVFYNQIYNDAVADFIGKRAYHLSSLSVKPTTIDILNNINTCVNLKKLSLSIDRKSDIGVAIENMNELEVLKIDVEEKENFLFLGKLQSSITKNSWPHLSEVSITLRFLEEVQILKSLIQNAKLLKKLCFHDYRFVTEENQIAKVDTLLKLESLTLYGVKTLSEPSLSIISNCNNLKYLQIFVRVSVLQNRYLHVANMVRGMEKLSYCDFSTNHYMFHLSSRANIEERLTAYRPNV